MWKTLHQADGSTREIHLQGWKKQHTDARDEEFRLKLHGSFLKIAPSADNRPFCSPVEDQGSLGACTAHMFAALVESNEIRRVGPLHDEESVAPSAQVNVSNITVAPNGVITFATSVTPPIPAPTPPPVPTPTPAPKLVRASRLFQYYATRTIEGTVSEDSGATIRDAIKAGSVYGVADESLWGYDVSKFTANPPPNVWAAAATHKVTSYHAITDGDVQSMKSILAGGSLIGFGFQVYDYMMSAEMASTGFLPVPGPNEQLQGGHAVALVGYDDAKQAFLVRNSWGTGWGLAGYFYMAYSYVGNTQLASDFWVVQSAPI